MDALEAIFTRRSIRLYAPKHVSREAVNDVLKAAMSAPSAGNERPWHFIVLSDRMLLDKIMQFHPYASMLKHAQTAILTCCDLTLERHAGYWVLDCAAATENMLLAAHAKGLGAVWCGVFPTEDRIVNFRKLLTLPESVVPFSLVPLGFPEEVKAAPDRYDASRVHENRW